MNIHNTKKLKNTLKEKFEKLKKKQEKEDLLIRQVHHTVVDHLIVLVGRLADLVVEDHHLVDLAAEDLEEAEQAAVGKIASITTNA
jgi:two-component sensor histidine kinase